MESEVKMEIMRKWERDGELEDIDFPREKISAGDEAQPTEWISVSWKLAFTYFIVFVVFQTAPMWHILYR